MFMVFEASTGLESFYGLKQFMLMVQFMGVETFVVLTHFMGFESFQNG